MHHKAIAALISYLAIKTRNPHRAKCLFSVSSLLMAGKDRILVLGPTGAIGRHIVWASVKAGNPTYVLVRDTPPTVNKPRLVTAANPETRDELLQNFQNAGVFLIQVRPFSLPLFLTIFSFHTICFTLICCLIGI